MAGEEQDRDVLLGHLPLEPLQSIQDVPFGGLCIGKDPCFHAAVKSPLLLGPGRAEVQGVLGGETETQFSILVLTDSHGQDIKLGLDLELLFHRNRALPAEPDRGRFAHCARRFSAMIETSQSREGIGTEMSPLSFTDFPAPSAETGRPSTRIFNPVRGSGLRAE